MIKNAVPVALLASLLMLALASCAPECVEDADCHKDGMAAMTCRSGTCVTATADGGTGGGSATGGGTAGGGTAGGGTAGGGTAGGGTGGGGTAGGGTAGGGTAGDAGMVDAGTAPTITTTSPLAAGTVGKAFSLTLTASGDSPIVWTVSAGAIPPGLTLDPTTGVYAGAPTALGTFTFTVTATNSLGSANLSVTHTINAPPADGHVLLSNNRLAEFSTLLPGTLTPVALTGVTAGEELVGIDRRPNNGVLYGLGVNPTTNTATLYAISPSTAFAAPVGTASSIAFTDGAGMPIDFPALASWGFDVNPAVDRVRVTTSSGLNFRLNPNTGAPVDGDLGGAAGSVAGVNPDGAINGGGVTSVSEVAYTNNVANGAGVTTLYTLGPAGLFIQNPPNAGTQTAGLTLAPAATSVLGFDIAPGVDAPTSGGPVPTGSGVAVVKLSASSAETLVTVNLVTGAVSSVGSFGAGGIVGLALQKPPDMPMIALAASGTSLSRFYRYTPGTTVTVALTGLVAGETLVGIDLRPQTGQLMGLGVNAAADTGTLYVVDPQTGALSIVGAAASVAFSSVDFPDPATAGYGFDFNPTTDLLRVVTTTGLNFRVNPITGAAVDGDYGGSAGSVAGVNPDGLLHGSATSATALAYTNSVGGPLVGRVTTLYAVDATSNSLFIESQPSAGVLTTRIPLTLAGSPLDISGLGGFDLPGPVRVTSSSSPATGLGYGVFTVGVVTGLYVIDLATGGANMVGTVGSGNVSYAGFTVGRNDLL